MKIISRGLLLALCIYGTGCSSITDLSDLENDSIRRVTSVNSSLESVHAGEVYLLNDSTGSTQRLADPIENENPDRFQVWIARKSSDDQSTLIEFPTKRGKTNHDENKTVQLMISGKEAQEEVISLQDFVELLNRPVTGYSYNRDADARHSELVASILRSFASDQSNSERVAQGKNKVAICASIRRFHRPFVTIHCGNSVASQVVDEFTNRFRSAGLISSDDEPRAETSKAGSVNYVYHFRKDFTTQAMFVGLKRDETASYPGFGVQMGNTYTIALAE